MTQLDMFAAPLAREKVRRRVRDTSIQQYAEGRERFTGRRANVLRWLAAYYNRRQEWPTSSEVLAWAWDDHSDADDDRCFRNYDAAILYVRRGMSDLQTSGVVAANGKRTCRQTGRVCETWRVIPVGRT